MDVEIEKEQEECDCADGEVDPKVPAPRDVFGEDTAEDGAQAARDCPHEFEDAHIKASFSGTCQFHTMSNINHIIPQLTAH
jgi:hypothetical protein